MRREVMGLNVTQGAVSHLLWQEYGVNVVGDGAGGVSGAECFLLSRLVRGAGCPSLLLLPPDHELLKGSVLFIFGYPSMALRTHSVDVE